MLSPPYNLTRTLLLAVAVVFGSLYPAAAQSLTPSPNCTQGPSVIDATGGTWTFVSGRTVRDGVWMGGGSGQAYFFANSIVYTLSSDQSWYQWIGTRWMGLTKTRPACEPTNQPPSSTTATFAGIDTTTQGRWKGVYGSLGYGLYNDDSSITEATFERGGGTLGGLVWPTLAFDPTLPQRSSMNNCCSPVPYAGTDGIPHVVATGAPWPADARFGAGLYRRVADVVPFRIGITLIAPRRVRLYVVDYTPPGQMPRHRSERIDVYAQTSTRDADNETGHPGVSYVAGALLDSRTVSQFEGGQYLTWDITGPVIFQFTGLPDDSDITAVENGLFLDPIGVTGPPPVDGCPQVEPIIRHAPAPIPQGSVFHVVADHDGLTCAAGVPATIDSAACLLDGVTRIPAVITPAGTGLTLTCTPVGLPAGEHTAQVGVMNSSGENWSDVLGFTITAPAPQPVDCVLSEWTPWSAWTLINATQEGRTRTRAVLTPAANGGMTCPSPLLETETRAIAPPTPPTGIRIQGAVTVDGIDHPFTVTVP